MRAMATIALAAALAASARAAEWEIEVRGVVDWAEDGMGVEIGQEVSGVSRWRELEGETCPVDGWAGTVHPFQPCRATRTDFFLRLEADGRSDWNWLFWNLEPGGVWNEGIDSGAEFGGTVVSVEIREVVAPPPPPPPPAFVRGDVNEDGFVDVSDPIGLLGVLFRGEPAPDCLAACDANDDEIIDISDAVSLLVHLFRETATAVPVGGCVQDEALDPSDCSGAC